MQGAVKLVGTNLPSVVPSSTDTFTKTGPDPFTLINLNDIFISPRIKFHGLVVCTSSFD